VGALFGTTNIRIGDLDLAGVDDTGVEIGIDVPDGWSGQPASTGQADQKTLADGGIVSAGYAATRNIGLSGWLRASDADVLTAGIDRLNSMLEPRAARRLEVTEHGITRWVNARRLDVVDISRKSLWYATWSAQFAAVGAQPSDGEWRKFGADMVAVTALPSSSGGLQLPFIVPFAITAETVTGQIALTNPGNATGPVKLRIDGPVRGPIITHVSSGKALVLSSSLTIGAGEWLDIDMEARTVLANGQASRGGWIVQRGWFGFDPADNVFAFTATQFDAGARLTVTATPAWL
jgi:hypothetical protein